MKIEIKMLIDDKPIFGTSSDFDEEHWEPSILTALKVFNEQANINIRNFKDYLDKCQ